VIARVCAVVADERAIAEKEEVRIRVKEGIASIATEAIDVPPVAGCLNISTEIEYSQGRSQEVSCGFEGWGVSSGIDVPSSKALPSSRIYRKSKSARCAQVLSHWTIKYLSTSFARIDNIVLCEWGLWVCPGGIHFTRRWWTLLGRQRESMAFTSDGDEGGG